ncbi:hypothetical protein GS898_08960 [Rhodococcus hoagii]|nr:hypothetical protein [Prescottella equi]
MQRSDGGCRPVVSRIRVLRGAVAAGPRSAGWVTTPGGTNVIASRVDLWVDVRHPDDHGHDGAGGTDPQAAAILAAEEGCTAAMKEESFSPTSTSTPRSGPPRLRTLGRAVLGTGAGHDAGVLKDHVPTAMLFVRNPTGISHSPSEYVESDDGEAALWRSRTRSAADARRRHTGRVRGISASDHQDQVADQ